MADQKINALPVKTSPTTGDKMLMIGAAEEYQIDYDQLATAILNKLTSKTFTLDQGTKSLVAALNELNSNMVSTIITDRLQRPISMDALDKHPIVIGPASHIEYLPENIPAGSWVIIFTFVYSSSVAVQFITSVFTNHNKICKRYRSGAWSEFVAIINI